MDEDQKDEIELNTNQRFIKMIGGVAAGWIAKEAFEKGYTKFVIWNRDRKAA